MGTGGLRHTKTTGDQEWSTPPEIVDAVIAALGSVGLDPCSNVYSLVPAKRRYSLPDHDGLEETWGGFRTIYVNPPYGRDKKRGTGISDWLRRCDEASSHAQVIALVPVATNTGHWKRHVVGRASAICFLDAPRLKFVINGARSQKGAPMAICAIYWGTTKDRFRRAFAPHGWTMTMDKRHSRKAAKASVGVR